MKYMVKLEKGVYLANWRGDPGRTLKIDSAKKFKNRKAAKKSITESRKFRPFPKAEIIEISN